MLKKGILSGLLGLSLIVGCSGNDLKIKYSNPKSLGEIVFYTRCLLEYRSELEETWNSPKNTRKLGFGDCDDIALVGADFAEKLGYRPKILCLYGGGEGHAVALLEKGSLYGALEKSTVIPLCRNLDELVEKISDYHCLYDRERFNSYRIIDLNVSYPNWKKSDNNLWPILDPLGAKIIEKRQLLVEGFIMNEKRIRFKSLKELDYLDARIKENKEKFSRVEEEIKKLRETDNLRRIQPKESKPFLEF